MQPQQHLPLFESETVTCPVCGGRSERLFRKHGYWIRSCQACQHRFAELTTAPLHVDTVYNDSYFAGGGAGYPDYLAEAELLRHQGRRYASLLFRYMSPGVMLDVGAAAGLILQGFIDCGWQGDGIEPNASMANYARSQLGLSMQVTAFEQFSSPKAYDLITMIQVLPHFFDLRRALQIANDHTKPGGFWLIETWNRDSWTAKLCGQNWHEYSPPSVLHWFSPKGLRQLGSQYGFRAVAQGRPSKRISGIHAKSLLRYKLADLPLAPVWQRLLSLLPDQMMIPYPSEDLFWMLLQKQS